MICDVAAAFVLATLVLGSVGTAADPNVVQELSAGRFVQVEERYAALQRDFMQGHRGEYDLLDAYKAFYQKEDRYGPLFDEWRERYPQSASAEIATGVYLRKLGEFRRGTGPGAGVPADSRQYLGDMLEAAKWHLQRGLALEPKSYIAALHLLNIAQFQSDHESARLHVERANAILPGNFLARARFLVHLAPKWGGSFEDMERFVDECRDSALPKDRLQWLTAIVEEEQGADSEYDGRMDVAEARYLAALKHAQTADARFHNDYLDFANRLCEHPPHAAARYCAWR